MLQLPDNRALVVVAIQLLLERLALVDGHQAHCVHGQRVILHGQLGVGQRVVAVQAERLASDLEHVRRPLAERVLLAAHLVAVGALGQALAAQVAEHRVHVLAVLAEVRVGRRAERKDGKAHIGQWAERLLGVRFSGGAALDVRSGNGCGVLGAVTRVCLHEGLGGDGDAVREEEGRGLLYVRALFGVDKWLNHISIPMRRITVVVGLAQLHCVQALSEFLQNYYQNYYPVRQLNICIS